MQSSLSTEVTENSLYPVLVPTAKDLEKARRYYAVSNLLNEHIHYLDSYFHL